MNTTLSTLRTALINAKGCKFVDVTYFSELKAGKDYRKSNNPFNDRVSKIVEMGCQFNYSYTNAVNNRLEKIGITDKMAVAPLPWGVWSVMNKLIDHNGKEYLRLYKVKNKIAKVTYLLDGRPMTETEFNAFKAFLPTPKPSAKQSAMGLTENQVQPFALCTANILNFTMDKVVYEVEGNEKYKAVM